jgi:hypothetical protein
MLSGGTPTLGAGAIVVATGTFRALDVDFDRVHR